MNFIDLLFLLLLFAIVATGFFKGMIRIGVLIVAFYLSVVLSSLYYPQVGYFFFSNFGGTARAGNYIGFFILLAVSFSLLSTAGLYTFRYADLPGKLKILDHAVGSLLSLILAALVLGMLAVLLWNLMVTAGGKNVDIPLFQLIGSQVETSVVLRYFAVYILPRSYTFVDPVLPNGASLIFGVVQ